MKKSFLFFIVLAVLFSSCKPSPESIEQAIAETQKALPTPTKIPFSQIPLEDLVFQEGDLPAGYSPAQIRSKLGDLTNDIPTPDNFISYGMSKNGSFGGLVDLLIFEDNKNIDAFYQSIYKNMPGKGDLATVGEKGYYAVNVMFVNTVSVTFYRCHALVSLQFQGTFIADDAISYAKRLDDRLKKKFCD